MTDSYFADASDDQIVNLGQSICSDLDHGGTFFSVSLTLADYMSPEHAGAVAGAAIGSLCERHMDELQ